MCGKTFIGRQTIPSIQSRFRIPFKFSKLLIPQLLSSVPTMSDLSTLVTRTLRSHDSHPRALLASPTLDLNMLSSSPVADSPTEAAEPRSRRRIPRSHPRVLSATSTLDPSIPPCSLAMETAALHTPTVLAALPQQRFSTHCHSRFARIVCILKTALNDDIKHRPVQLPRPFLAACASQSLRSTCVHHAISNRSG